ncbi:MAG TPA: TlpA family protein disulfide reductase [Crocinitomicaceae bacterium]|nr:TlpA family protein disulfide reductase [Crocinitomicaceae bacterium]
MIGNIIILLISLVGLGFVSCTEKTSEISIKFNELSQNISKIKISSYAGDIIYLDSNINNEIKVQFPSRKLDFTNDLIVISLFLDKNSKQVNINCPIEKNAENIYVLSDVEKDEIGYIVNTLGISFVVDFKGSEHLIKYASYIKGLESLDIEKDEIVKKKNYFEVLKSFILSSNNSQVGGMLLFALKNDMMQSKEKEFEDILEGISNIACDYNKGIYSYSCGKIDVELGGGVDCEKVSIEKLFLQSSNSYIHPSLLENNVVILDFWATWCSPCKEELFYLDSLNRAYYLDKKVEFIPVSIDKKQTTAWAYFEKHKDRLGTLYTFSDDGCMSQNYEITYIPRNFIYDKKGNLRYEDVHGEELKNAIDSLLLE